MAEGKEDRPKQLAWRRILVVLLAATMFCVAATAYGLAPVGSFLWKPMTNATPFGRDMIRLKSGESFEGTIVEIPAETLSSEGKLLVTLDTQEQRTFGMSEVDRYDIRHVPIRPMLIVAAAIFLIGFFLCLRIRRRLVFYKPAQGVWVRASGLIVILSLAIYGAYSIPVSGRSWWYQTWWDLSVLGVEVKFRNLFFPAMTAVMVTMLVCYLLLNRPKWADFQIETEGELKKVSWPAPKDFLGSSMVVLIVSVVIALFLFAVDKGLSALMRQLGFGF